MFNSKVTREIETSYYVIYEINSVISFLKKRLSSHNSVYRDSIDFGENYIDLRQMKRDEKRLDSEISFVESILFDDPDWERLTKDILPKLRKLKKKYVSLYKRSVKAIETIERERLDKYSETFDGGDEW